MSGKEMQSDFQPLRSTGEFCGRPGTVVCFRPGGKVGCVCIKSFWGRESENGRHCPSFVNISKKWFLKQLYVLMDFHLFRFVTELCFGYFVCQRQNISGKCINLYKHDVLKMSHIIRRDGFDALL
ncbi:hypothetical protein CEXT_15571 [Caerostris extrusa]|uniref:Uncharacterized protein n=1 Tax=Caerostris extrusa TaxID=172846 RepID=A0AAV4MBV3_CAEEX|nr:hypothetical protein CEXT_15571 [Caerostris extrusa]